MSSNTSLLPTHSRLSLSFAGTLLLPLRPSRPRSPEALASESASPYVIDRPIRARLPCGRTSTFMFSCSRALTRYAFPSFVPQVTIPRNGDLLSTLFLEVVLTKHDTAESFFPAEQFVREVELEIGGQKIDKITSDWLRLYSEVYHSSDEKAGYRRLVDFENPAGGADAGVSKRFFVPINFFFTRSPSLALPLVALQCALFLLHPLSLFAPTPTMNPIAHESLRQSKCRPRGPPELHVRDGQCHGFERCQHRHRADRCSVCHICVLG